MHLIPQWPIPTHVCAVVDRYIAAGRRAQLLQRQARGVLSEQLKPVSFDAISLCGCCRALNYSLRVHHTEVA